ncbi:MAG: hypothetical protein ETSY1_30265 [Candidatus Entotheonella factor]|uniref:Tricarboxylate transporter n=1 Tax=Entotheonella factor TaxID=1429438 RepID=W4LCT0_ENTF1|nr:tripartite tricarboxylate transporter substrate-binding protein [Candidatus Entotheonella palauensis]ETW95530.1 MAG: hypothetical protein ETSY1_30265 [Candidatus Entotheonella factor]
MKRWMAVWATLVGLALVVTPGLADEFYKGKTLRFIVGASAGGGFDTYTRVIARHISKHIPGQPATVVQNMPGAGTLIAANYLYNKSKPDGLTIGLWSGGLVLMQAMEGRPGIKFDARKFEWVGVPITDHPACTLTKASGITNLEQWMAASEPVKLGAGGPGSSPSDLPKLLQAALGLPMKLVEGYKGTSKIRLAAETGEVAGGCWAWESIKVTWREALASGAVVPVVQMNPERHPDLPDLPNAIELAKTDEARQLLGVIHDRSSIVRAFSLPPGTPADRVSILQAAFMATMSDPEFIADTQKAKLDLSPKSGAEVKRIVHGFLDLDPAVLKKLKGILGPKG